MLVAACVAAAAERGVVLERVAVSRAGVELTLSAPLAIEARALPGAGDAAARWYVDLPATVGSGVARTIAGTSPLLRVRTAQRDDGGVRVVLDLDRAAPCAVEGRGRRITLRLDGAAPAPPSVPSGGATTAPSSPPAPSGPAAKNAARPRLGPAEEGRHILLYDPRDFDLPRPPDDEPPPDPHLLPRGHPPVLRYDLGPPGSGR